MKKRNLLNILFVLFTPLFLATGCDEGNAITENMAYIKDAFYRKYSEVYLDLIPSTLAVPVNLTRVDHAEDVKVRLDVAEKELQQFNIKYNREYVLYPGDMWSLENNEVTIRKGSAGTAANLTIQPFTEEMIESGIIYVIPLRIANSDGTGVLQGSDVYFYILRQTPIATVGQTSGSQRVKFKTDHLGEKLEFNELTVEFMFCLNGGYTKANNQGLFYNNGKAESGQIFSRLEGGLAGLQSAALEWNIGSTFINAFPPSGSFKINTWYHVALQFGQGSIKVYIDGVLVASREVTATSLIVYTEITDVPDWDGFAWEGAGSNNTMFAEVRLWNVLRTQDQIQENMYRVNPDSDGLLGYWKIDDGEGITFKDYAQGGRGEGGYLQQAGTIGWFFEQNLSVGQ